MKFLRDRKVRDVLWQVLASVGLVAVVVFFVRNASDNMVKAGMASGFQFLWRDCPRVLPVWDGGHLRLVAWGCRRGESRQLPNTSCTWLASRASRIICGRRAVELGSWAINLIATRRPSDVSSASHTMPVPPLPIGRSNRY